MRRRFDSQFGFTLVEMLVATTVAAAVGGFALAYLHVGTILFAKNVTVNYSNNSLRWSVDEAIDRVQSSAIIPVLIDTTGTAAITSTSAGIYYDRLLGDMYVVTNPSGTGLAATANSATLTYSTNQYASPPVPQAGDVVLFNGASSGMRPMVSTASMGSTTGSTQAVTVTFTAALGTAVSWTSSQIETAQLVHREALIVMPNGSAYEFRRYPSFETTANLNDATKYVVLSGQVGTQGSEPTPFTIVASGPDQLLSMTYVVRAGPYQNYLANKEANQFSSYQTVRTTIPLRQRPTH